MLSMVTPRLSGIGLPSFCQVIVIGKSPETTTHGMKTRCPMENLGDSKGWMKGGTEKKKEKALLQIYSRIRENYHEPDLGYIIRCVCNRSCSYLGPFR